jgi:type I restriction enzyme S subunit
MHSDILRIRLDQNRCLSDFLSSALALNQEVKAQIDTVTSGATTQGINVTRLKHISIRVPPLSLQREFAARVAEARALQDQQARSRVRLDEGFQAMLHKAFAGEL